MHEPRQFKLQNSNSKVVLLVLRPEKYKKKDRDEELQEKDNILVLVQFIYQSMSNVKSFASLAFY
jgi:hypothetical protein